MAFYGAQVATYNPAAPPAGWTEMPADYDPYAAGGFYEGLYPTDPTVMEDAWAWYEANPQVAIPGTYEEALGTYFQAQYGQAQEQPVEYQTQYDIPVAQPAEGPIEGLWNVISGTPQFLAETAGGAVELVGGAGDVAWDVGTGVLEFAGDVFTGVADFVWDAASGTIKFIGDAAKFILDRLEIRGGYTGGGGPTKPSGVAGGERPRTESQLEAEAAVIDARRKLIEQQLAAGMQPMDLFGTSGDQPVFVTGVPAGPNYLLYLALGVGAYILLKGR